MSKRFRIWLLLFFFSGAVCTSTVLRADIDGTIDVNGVGRRYVLHLPPTPDKKPLPLVMAFHGGSGSAEGFRAVTGLNVAADQYGFAVVYPNSIDGFWGTYRPETGDPVADLAFVDALLSELRDSYKLDPSRVYATGLSNGGEFSFLLGLQRQNRFAAVAPVAMHLSEDLLNSVTPNRAMPVLNIVGYNDPLVLYDGGPIQTPNGQTQGVLISSDATMDYFAKLNMTGKPVRTPLVNPVKDGTLSVIDVFQIDELGTALERITVFGGGHTWPGGVQYLPESLIGLTSLDFNANDVIWNFFSSQSIPVRDRPVPYLIGR